MGLHAVPHEDDEVVYMVVGDEAESKSQVADVVRKLYGASQLETTPAGVRIFTSTSSREAIVDTTPFTVPQQGDLSLDRRQQIARQWISQNSLRRLLLGKLLSVVCVVTKSVDCEIMASGKKFAWLDILVAMFQEHKNAIKILVNTQHIDEDNLTSAKEHIERILNQHGFMVGNTSYLDWSSRGEDVLAQVEDSVRLEAGKAQLVKSIVGDDGLVEDPVSPPNCPWDPERVILFGRTGSGKSTLAQMLTKGHLDPDSKKFSSSSGIRGQTKRVSYGQGRGWYVVDTPGFGEPNRGQSSVPTKEAEDRIKKFVKQIDGLFTHFLFVVKKDRIDELEVRLWRFFVCLFGEEIYDHFSIVVSNADEEWVSTNRNYLEDIFKGCESFLCAEFPSSQAGDDEWEEELQQIRTESLKRMENELALLSRTDIVCEFGDLSRTAVLSRKIRYQGQGLREIRHNASILVMRICTTMACLTQALTIDEEIALLPF